MPGSSRWRIGWSMPRRPIASCACAHGDIAAVEQRWAAAAWWFARTVAAAPSSPFAYADWGEMLLRKGDFAGAMAQFAIANKKGPHFADPLEMWGEALVASNRSNLALAKFADAARYAPNWGRLHLKWGEALLWLGQKNDAAKQFALAAGLWLTPHETAELARVRTGHG
jgi:tetratricopeptide (TPR) repeat protein